MYNSGPVYFPGAGLCISFKRRALSATLSTHMSYVTCCEGHKLSEVLESGLKSLQASIEPEVEVYASATSNN